MKFTDYHSAILALESQVQALYKDGPCNAEQVKEMDNLHTQINDILDAMSAYTDSLIAASNQRMLGQE